MAKPTITISLNARLRFWFKKPGEDVRVEIFRKDTLCTVWKFVSNLRELRHLAQEEADRLYYNGHNIKTIHITRDELSIKINPNLGEAIGDHDL
jgi:hypothetical protein